MINVSGHLGFSSEDPIVDDSQPLRVSSCGHYRLVTQRELRTVRPQGRPDYQLIYVAAGAAVFHAGGAERRLREGSVVIYRPGEPQEYEYRLEDKPAVYWIHFTGGAIEDTLERLRLSGPVHVTGVRSDYPPLFDRIIRELQLGRAHFERLANLYLEELLTLLSRHAAEQDSRAPLMNEQVEAAIRTFHAAFREPINLAGYARSHGMSPCWFTRLFHRQTGLSPQQYLTNIRIGKARELLATTAFNVGEIAAMVGYPNPLYFSRIFRKTTGKPPTAYRAQQEAVYLEPTLRR